LSGLTVYDIDDIQQVVDHNIRQREACIPAIEHIIRHETEIFLGWARGRDVVPTITDLRQKIGMIAQTELDEMTHRLGHLAENDMALIQKLVHRLVNKILHDPTIALRQHAQQSDADMYTRVVRDLFSLAVADEGLRM
ncbi:MAG: glutamyl-tRNA reductase, partial [Anaerolineae bacterium]|nr:glutamyl-tRNA reductase [Anaerolineae bacterium]